MRISRILASLLALLIAAPARADVVINEILYHAPDDLDDVQFIELHNTGDKAVDLGGWKLTKSVKFTFPAQTTIAANGYVVVCKNVKEFRTYYGFEAIGPYLGSLDHGSDQIELVNGKNKAVDRVKYKSRAPWPVAADGYSSSLERICPTAMTTGPENWAPSPLSPGTPKPAGTPGKKNASYAATLPPIITNVTFTPKHAAPDQEITVEAKVGSTAELGDVELRYRVAGSGYEKEEKSLPMTKTPKGDYVGKIPPQKPKEIVRFRVRAVDKKQAERFFPHAHEVRPALSVYTHEPFKVGQCPFGLIINTGLPEFFGAKLGGFAFGGAFGASPPNPSARGKSAFLYVDQKSGEPTLFDFISISPRSGGYRIRFHKDRPLGDMTTIALIHEGNDRSVLAEPLAFELYRRAGNAACRTDFVRTWVDDRPMGYHLQIEVVNKAFLRHNKVRADGNLYKVNWFGNGVIGTHEKKTFVRKGHDDLIKVLDQLAKTKGDEQWAVIKKNFDVEQVINYFAVNMLLSHWDGYFNNHFSYHDVHGTGKWTMYPWDQDKTWGFHDGIRGYEVFTDMPITFGMEGDRPPGMPKNQPAPNNFNFALSIWWRPGGVFSRPLLANPQFRKLFLARTKELLETVYTEKVFFPIIDQMGERLNEEVKVRAELRRENPKQAAEHFRRNLGALKEHLTKRRAFLLAQEEIKKAGAFERTALRATWDDDQPRFQNGNKDNPLTGDVARNALIRMTQASQNPGVFGVASENDIKTLTVKPISEGIVEIGVYTCDLNAKTFRRSTPSFRIEGEFVWSTRNEWIARITEMISKTK